MGEKPLLLLQSSLQTLSYMGEAPNGFIFKLNMVFLYSTTLKPEYELKNLLTVPQDVISFIG